MNASITLRCDFYGSKVKGKMTAFIFGAARCSSPAITDNVKLMNRVPPPPTPPPPPPPPTPSLQWDRRRMNLIGKILPWRISSRPYTSERPIESHQIRRILKNPWNCRLRASQSIPGNPRNSYRISENAGKFQRILENPIECQRLAYRRIPPRIISGRWRRLHRWFERIQSHSRGRGENRPDTAPIDPDASPQRIHKRILNWIPKERLSYGFPLPRGLINELLTRPKNPNLGESWRIL